MSRSNVSQCVQLSCGHVLTWPRGSVLAPVRERLLTGGNVHCPRCNGVVVMVTRRSYPRRRCTSVSPPAHALWAYLIEHPEYEPSVSVLAQLPGAPPESVLRPLVRELWFGGRIRGGERTKKVVGDPWWRTKELLREGVYSFPS